MSASTVLTPTWGERLHAWRPVLWALALLAAVTVVTSLFAPPSTSKVDYAINNPHANGTMALAELLRHEGIDVDSPTTMAELVEGAGPGTTIALVNASLLSKADRQRLASLGADITVVGTRYQDLDGLFVPTQASPVPAGASIPAGTGLDAQCTDPDAVAAGSLDGTDSSIALPEGANGLGCFPVSESARLYAYAAVERDNGTTVRLIADPDMLTNDRLTTAGNAALAIRALGHHEHVLWADGAALTGSTSVWDNVSRPPWLLPFLFQATVVVTILAVVQGRRTGRLVEENLPVIVRATETTRGRGRLYRRAHDLERCATALRAGTALRLGRRLGVPASSDSAVLVDAVSTASGLPDHAVQELLCGPAPANAQALTVLAVQLDRLESEVISR